MTEQQRALVESVTRHEGLRLHPYTDTVGKTTIGYGRNLTDRGLSQREAAFLLANDLHTADVECRAAFEWFDDLTPARQNVLIEMAFSLGITRLLGFGQTLRAMREGRHEDAAQHMLKSRWALQVGQRARTLAERYRQG